MQRTYKVKNYPRKNESHPTNYKIQVIYTYIQYINHPTSMLTSSREPSSRATLARTNFPLLTGVFFFEGDGELAGPFSTPSESTTAGTLVSSGIVAPYYLKARNT
jgi:hypothetical protein